MKANFNQLIKVQDIFFISERIKDINENYILFYNTKNHRYEIHDIANQICSECITFFDYPTKEILFRLKSSNKQNMQKLLIDIEKHNEKLENERKTAQTNTAKDKLKAIINYAQTFACKDLSVSQIHKIIN